jgi:large subunit ribosomal protein L29
VTAVKTSNVRVEELRNKKVIGFKDMNVDELGRDLVSAKKELFNLRFQNATNQLDNTSRIKEVRRKIARIQTVITRKQRGIIS